MYRVPTGEDCRRAVPAHPNGLGLGLSLSLSLGLSLGPGRGHTPRRTAVRIPCSPPVACQQYEGRRYLHCAVHVFDLNAAIIRRSVWNWVCTIPPTPPTIPQMPQHACGLFVAAV